MHNAVGSTDHPIGEVYLFRHLLLDHGVVLIDSTLVELVELGCNRGSNPGGVAGKDVQESAEKSLLVLQDAVLANENLAPTGMWKQPRNYP